MGASVEFLGAKELGIKRNLVVHRHHERAHGRRQHIESDERVVVACKEAVRALLVAPDDGEGRDAQHRERKPNLELVAKPRVNRLVLHVCQRPHGRVERQGEYEPLRLRPRGLKPLLHLLVAVDQHRRLPVPLLLDLCPRHLLVQRFGLEILDRVIVVVVLGRISWIGRLLVLRLRVAAVPVVAHQPVAHMHFVLCLAVRVQFPWLLRE
mmetsp:Transcript_32438/g.79104  ORF Transcript_32438/g.79104 Transcript_32438/m.79104 type:complete len:209 (-) Transcript_32438:141-767(-)